MKKKTEARKDAFNGLYSALFRKKMAIVWQNKVYKKSPETARKHWLPAAMIATSKLQPMIMSKPEKATAIQLKLAVKTPY